MTASANADQLPPLSSSAVDLLRIVDQLPIRTRERDRMITALGLHSHSEWLRAEVAAESEHLEALRWADQFFTPHDLAHLIDFARLIAGRYGAVVATPGHIAVALVLSSRIQDDRLELTEVVSTAFGLGSLEDAGELRGAYLNWLEDDETSPVDGQIDLTYREPWASLDGLARWFDPGLRGILFLIFLVIEARLGAPLGWFFGVALLIPLRDSSLLDAPSITRLPVGVPTRFPLFLIFAGAAGLTGYSTVAGFFALSSLALEGVALIGEYLQARNVQADGPGIAALGAGGQSVVAAMCLVYRYPVHDRWIRFSTLVLVGTPLLIGSGAWPLSAVIYLLIARGSFGWGAALTVAALILAGVHPLVVGAAVLGLLSYAVIRIRRSVPPPPIPVPWTLPRMRSFSGLGAVARARRLLSHGKPESAVDVLRQWLNAPSSGWTDQRAASVRMLLAWALLESGQPGRAWELRDSFPPDATPFRTLIVARAMAQLRRWEVAAWGARELMERQVRGRTRSSAALDIQARLLWAEIRASEPNPAEITALIPAAVSKKNLHVTVVLLHRAGTSAMLQHPSVADRLLAVAFILGMLSRYSVGDGTIVERGGEPGELEKAGVKAHTTHQRLEFMLNVNVTAENFGQWRYGCEALFRLGAEIDTAFEMVSMATLLQQRPELRSDAYQCRWDALAVFNATRHDFAHRDDRLAWWETFSGLLDAALAEAVRGKDWAGLAELIEAARMQSDLQENSQASGNGTPYVRVGGVSRLERGFWQRPDAQVNAYHLEEAAEAVLGSGTWWWSTWRSGETMYWSLVRHGVAPRGGSQPFAAIAEVLAELRDALPLRYPGEDDETFDDRMWGSPLLVGPIAAERELSRRLVSLLPAALRELLSQSSGDLRLAIAPAAEYAHVPWACIAIDDQDLRLIERARFAITPPIALLADIHARRGTAAPSELCDERAEHTEITPVSGAVIDPGGDLTQALNVLNVLPATAQVLTADDEPTREAIFTLLAGLDRASTFVFAGHTASSAATQGHAAMYLGAQVKPEHLDRSLAIAPSDLADRSQPLRFPRSVVLLACGSADLQNAAGGEWFTLAPAVLWSGAAQAVVTSFPIVDTDQMDRELVGELSRVPLHEALRAAQLSQLALWRSSVGAAGAPLHWGGHLGIGSFHSADRFHPRVPGAGQRWIHDGLVGLLERSAEISQMAGRDVVEIDDVWDEVLAYGWEDRAFWRAKGMTALSFIRNVPFWLRYRRNPDFAGESRIGFSDDVVALFQDAVEVATTLHHPVVKPDHLIAALLRRPGSFASLCRVISGQDPRRPESLGFQLEKENIGWEHTGIHQTVFLRYTAIEELCQQSGVVVSAPERWYFTDRQ